MKKKIRMTRFEEDLKKDLKNQSFRKLFELEKRRLEVALLIAEMRKRKKISQVQLAKAIDTNQSAVVRIESGSENITIDTLSRVADALKKKLRIQFV